jgi:hypothetical protein
MSPEEYRMLKDAQIRELRARVAELERERRELRGAVLMGLEWIRDLNPKAPTSAVWDAMARLAATQERGGDDGT